MPVSSTEYYLIENRQRIGADRNLPSHGVLIYFCDDSIPECRQGKAPAKIINADPSIHYLKGAPFGPEKNNSYTDEKHNLSIQILDKQGKSYKISVSNNV